MPYIVDSQRLLSGSRHVQTVHRIILKSLTASSKALHVDISLIKQRNVIIREKCVAAAERSANFVIVQCICEMYNV